MNAFRGPFSSSLSKASPSTLCQKCLKRGHYSYECKASTQERPYVSRPSRTQQLADPKLKPKLTADAPNELLRKKGVADEELAKKEIERGRKRKFEDEDEEDEHRRSLRSSSFSSVSTISTNKSRSISVDRDNAGHTGQSQMMSGLEIDRRRRRSSSGSMSYTSEGNKGSIALQTPHDRSRNDRGRFTTSKDLQNLDKDRPPKSRRRRSPSESSMSHSSYDASHENKPWSSDRSKRRRRASQSPDDRGRGRYYENRRGSRRTHSPSESKDRSLVTRHRKSMTPGLPVNGREALHLHQASSPTSFRDARSYQADHHRHDERQQPRNAYEQQENRRDGGFGKRRERSLSPYSKRLALTQAMNTGR